MRYSPGDLYGRYADVVVHRQLLAALAGAAVPPQPHADLAAAAHTMNVRHRQAKAAQKECSELFLLLLLHAKPHVERALVGGVGGCQYITFFSSASAVPSGVRLTSLTLHPYAAPTHSTSMRTAPTSCSIPNAVPSPLVPLGVRRGPRQPAGGVRASLPPAGGGGADGPPGAATPAPHGRGRRRGRRRPGCV